LISIKEAIQKVEPLLTRTETRVLAEIGKRRRDSWLASRFAIKKLGQGQNPALSLESIETSRDKSSPPCCIFPDGRSIPVSVSHDNWYVIAAASPPGSKVGVDIEPISLRCLRVINHFFPGWTDDAEKSTRLWTACEAVAKCSQTHLLTVLRSAKATSQPEYLMQVDLDNPPSYVVRQTLFENRILSLVSS
jgi:phosphopantetheinyl transferase